MGRPQVKVTVDTNVLVRAVVRDDEKQAKAAIALLTSAELVAVSLPCLCELVWVLGRVYKLKQPDILAALEALRPKLPVTAQAVRNGLAMVELPGRFQIVPGQPVLVLDVAHNPHSAAALAANLDAMGFYPHTHAVFGAMADKDLAPMLKKMGPLVDRWYFTDLPTPRAQSAANLLEQWQALKTRGDESASIHTNPKDAFDSALAAADPADRIVVFGSFYTVGGVLKDGIPRLGAKHV